MEMLIKNAAVYTEGVFKNIDVLISDGKIASLATDISSEGRIVFNFSGCNVFPGFIDVHVHFREPGFSYKETIASGSLAAASAGYTTVFTMPNVNPVPDDAKHLALQTEIISRDAVIEVLPYGSITKGEKGSELSEMDDIAPYVAAFSDDGVGVSNGELMRKAMLRAKRLSKIIVAHCEDSTLTADGIVHEGGYALKHGLKGIPAESEWAPLMRDITLARQTGCKYHACHLSSAYSIDIISKAKQGGIDVTCETAPHYLLLNDKMIEDDGKYRVNPPIRSESDRLALVEAVCNGTIDMIATDHAPHSEAEKSGGLENSKMGLSGIEIAFPLLYTNLVKQKLMTLDRLIRLMSISPAERFGLSCGIKVGNEANLCVYDLNREYKVEPECFISKGKSTPFAGWTVNGKCLMTIARGKTVWQS